MVRCIVGLFVLLVPAAGAQDYPARDLKNDIEKWARVVKTAGIKPED